MSFALWHLACTPSKGDGARCPPDGLYLVTYMIHACRCSFEICKLFEQVISKLDERTCTHSWHFCTLCVLNRFEAKNPDIVFPWIDPEISRKTPVNTRPSGYIWALSWFKWAFWMRKHPSNKCKTCFEQKKSCQLKIQESRYWVFTCHIPTFSHWRLVAISHWAGHAPHALSAKRSPGGRAGTQAVWGGWELRGGGEPGEFELVTDRMLTSYFLKLKTTPKGVVSIGRILNMDQPGWCDGSTFLKGELSLSKYTWDG